MAWMHLKRPGSLIKESQNHHQPRRHGLLILVALLVFIELVSFLVYWWPFPYLGFRFDLATQVITAIEPGSAADLAGLRTGDRILQLYGLPWDVVVHDWNVLELAGPLSQPIAIEVQRGTDVYRALLHQQPPTLTFQLMKVTTFLLALVCWFTGLVLGTVRRHDVVASPLIAFFWLVSGGVIGAFIMARSISIPVLTVLQWFLLCILLPLSVYVHLWFPARPVHPTTARWARRALLTSWAGLHIALLSFVVLQRPTLTTLSTTLESALPFALLAACAGDVIVLWHANRSLSIAHIRRQIWLIALACTTVAALWVCFLLLPYFVQSIPLFVDRGIDLVAVLIPIAYLLSGVLPDLARITYLLTHLAAFMVVAAMVFVGFVVIDHLGMITPQHSVMLAVFGTMMLSLPLIGLVRRLVPAQIAARPGYRSLHSTVNALTTSLDIDVLTDTILQGVRGAFHNPACALYLRTQGGRALVLARQFRLPDLPSALPAGVLVEALHQKAGTWCETQALRSLLAYEALDGDELAVLYHPGIALWWPMHDPSGGMPAALLLGIDGTLDPYRATDLREIENFATATTLALRNSVAYQQRCVAEETVRQLYRQLHESQATAAATIVRELHDEVINLHIRLNVQALEHLIENAVTPDLRSELLLLLQSERTIGEALRMVCEQLRPTATGDPLGLPGLLRVNMERIAASWLGMCRLSIINEPLPVSPQVQQAIVLVAREAVTNAIKHAAGDTIDVTLRYPQTADGLLELVIEDNGRATQAIAPKPGHWGIHFMCESAASVGGELEFARAQGGGTVLLCTTPLATDNFGSDAERRTP